MTRNTETDLHALHALLDGLTNGEHAKATWKFDRHVVTAEGPVSVDGPFVQCDLHIRWENGGINDRFTSIEVARDEEVTATRDDEKVLHKLLNSLEDGQEITTEWRNERGSMVLTGTVRTGGAYIEVGGYYTLTVRQHTGELSGHLLSVTVRRSVVQRWERDSDE